MDDNFDKYSVHNDFMRDFDESQMEPEFSLSDLDMEKENERPLPQPIPQRQLVKRPAVRRKDQPPNPEDERRKINQFLRENCKFLLLVCFTLSFY